MLSPLIKSLIADGLAGANDEQVISPKCDERSWVICENNADDGRNARSKPVDQLGVWLNFRYPRGLSEPSWLNSQRYESRREFSVR